MSVIQLFGPDPNPDSVFFLLQSRNRVHQDPQPWREDPGERGSSMVLILDGKSGNLLQENMLFVGEKTRFVTTLDLNKYLKQIK